MTLDEVKRKIIRLYRAKQKIHVSVALSPSNVTLPTQEAVITDIYPNIFRIKTRDGSHTLIYADIITNYVKIAEIS